MSEEDAEFRNALYSDIGDNTKSQHLADMLKQQSFFKYDSQCVRTKSNISRIGDYAKFDHEYFSKKSLLQRIPTISPKLHELLNNIQALDASDMRKDGKMYKHFIFSDLNNGAAGVKLLASAMIAMGYNLGYTAKPIPPKEKVLHKNLKTNSISNSKSNTKSISPSKSNSIKQTISDDEDEDEDEEYEDDDDEDEEKQKPYEKIILKSEEELKKTPNNFFLLSSTSVYYQKITVELKKQILNIYNKRPENSYGDLARFIIMDSGYKEGIDLFDVKYVHIFEPSIVNADQKQVIGRGTRTCGQKGLEFHPTKGWPLHVFIYDLSFPREVQSQFMNSYTAIELYMKSMNIDFRMYKFSNQLEKMALFGSVDYELNKNIHTFSADPMFKSDFSETEFNYNHSVKKDKQKVSSSPQAITNGDILHTNGLLTNLISEPTMGFQEMRDYVKDNFSQFTWDKVEMKNLCISDEGEPDENKPTRALIQYTPTQDFIRHFFTPHNPIKGMLLYHSVGTGKTCTAIATATSSFEKEGYTVLWVTRTTLKSDIWKNMFDMVCNDNIREKIMNSDLRIPKDMKDRMKLISKSWRIRPMSYKQFSNLIMKRNDFYKKLTNINGHEDPLRRTLLIIDEAHKLYGGEDLSSIERPNMEEFHKAIMNSYTISGVNSVKLLLMTATPISKDPMELIKLINLCKLPTQQLPTDFDAFSDMYLNYDGRFSFEGSARFLDSIAGNISYLNREKDARQFAQPILHHINVPIIDNTDFLLQYENKYVRNYIDSDIIPIKNELNSNIKELEKYKNVDKDSFPQLKNKCKMYGDNTKEYKECVRIVNRNIRELIKEFKEESDEIKNRIIALKQEFKNKNAFKNELLQNVKENILNNRNEYDNYLSSTYYRMLSQCGKTIKSEADIMQIILELPAIKQLNEEIESDKYNIQLLKARIKTVLKQHRLKIRELKKMVESSGDTTNDKALKMIIANEKKIFKNIVMDMKDNIEEYNTEYKETRKQRKAAIHKLTKTAKQMLKDEIKAQNEIVRVEKKTRKALRKQEDYIEELKDEKLIQLNEKYKNLIENEITSKIENKHNKTRKIRRTI